VALHARTLSWGITAAGTAPVSHADSLSSADISLPHTISAAKVIEKNIMAKQIVKKEKKNMDFDFLHALTRTRNHGSRRLQPLVKAHIQTRSLSSQTNSSGK
jgi:hypothetical protein